MYRHIQELQKRVAVIEQELRLEALSNENTRIKRQLSELEGQEKIVFLETLRQSREISELENVSEVYGRLRISNRKLFDVVKEHGLFGGEPKAREPLQDLQKGIKDIEKELRLGQLQNLSNKNQKLQRALKDVEDQEKVVFYESVWLNGENLSVEMEISEVYVRLKTSKRKLFEYKVESILPESTVSLLESSSSLCLRVIRGSEY